MTRPAHRGALASGDAVSGWQPIETAPRDGTRVLLYRPSAQPFAQVGGGSWFPNHLGSYWTADSRGTWTAAELKRWAPTHWMPLPSPPKTP